MKPAKPRDLFPLAEPFEVVSLPSGDISYEPQGYRQLLLSLARDYSPRLAVRMNRVWMQGRHHDFEQAAYELLRLGYGPEADLLLSHYHRGQE